MMRRFFPSTIRQVGSEFDPTTIGNCEIWFDASDDSTIIRDGTEFNAQESATLDLIEQLNDKSGNGRNISQATSGNRPVVSTILQNGKQQIRSISTGRWLQSQSDFTLSGYPITFFLVGAHGQGCWASYAQPSVNNRRINFNNQSNTSANFQVRSGGAGTQGITPNTTVVLATHYINEGIAQSDDLRRFAINGGSYSDNTENVLYTNSTRFFLFRSSNQNPIGMGITLFGEVLMYSKVLTSGERTQVIDYLASKWGITI